MWLFHITIVTAVVILVDYTHALNESYHQYSPFLSIKQWLNPPNRRAYQRLTLQRMLHLMDFQADPCEDFYQFACGNYEKLMPENIRKHITNPLEEVTYVSAVVVKDYINPDLRSFRTETERKLRDFLQSCINSKDNLQSMADFVRSFGSWPALDNRWSERTFDFWEMEVAMGRLGSGGFFTFTFAPAKRDRIDVGITSLVLNKSVIYNFESDAFIKMVTESPQNIVQSTYLYNMIPRVQAFFIQMQQIWQNSQQMDEGNEFYLHELQTRAPGCDFARLFSFITGRRHEATETIIVPYLDYVEHTCQLVQRTDKKTLADFFLITILSYADDWREVSGMDSETLKQHCKNEAKVFFGPVITSMLAKDYVTKETKQEVMNLTTNLQKVGMHMILSNTSWLDETTRRKAAKKMEGVTPRIAYPDYAESEEELLKFYSKVDIETGNYLQNRKHLTMLKSFFDLDVIGKDYSYANALFNPLVSGPHFEPKGRGVLRVQAASLMPPLYHKFAPSFVKHSTVLSILGHELMHNFDVTGIDIDEHGKKNQWMTANRYLSYNYRSECIYSQYANYKLDNSDIYINSSATMGENVADNDGLKIAFELFKQWIAENPDKVWEEEFTFAPLQMTHEQAFFLSFAQFWCDAQSFDKLVEQIGDDEHAPGKFRVIGPLSNIPGFATAFNCPANSKMNPTEKCSYFFD